MKIILDTFYNYNETIFEFNQCENIVGGSWMCLLYKLAKNQGIEVLLAKTYLKEQEFSKDDLILSESGHTFNTKKLRKTGATPLVIFSGESPNVDWKFYLFVRYYTKSYKHAFIFSGVGRFVLKTASFFPFLWPNNLNDFKDLSTYSGHQRPKKLVMIISNKKQSSTLLKTIFLSILTYIIPALKLKDLYKVRMKALVYFSNKNYFSLFGKGWETNSNLTTAEKEAVNKIKPTPVANKHKILLSFDFALCFENCVYEGYITEKIFDCFFSECIPIYYGAPDVEKHIPNNTYVDARLFKSFDLLAQYLENVTDQQIAQYRRNIKDFLSSESFLKFTDVRFCENILSIVEDHKLV